VDEQADVRVMAANSAPECAAGDADAGYGGARGPCREDPAV
jgi:hypothetical protein